jgi:integrase
MSLQKPTTHTLIDRKLVIYKRERSAIWQCRFNVDGRWQRTSTGTRDLADAKAKAHDILVEANTLKRLNVAPITRRFKDIANAVIKKLKAEMASGNGKAIYKDYISAIDKYLIPTLGKYAVNNVGYKELGLLDKARIKKMEKQPTRSTLLNHNAALKMIFDEAIYKGYMVELNRPKLVAKGKASERRAEFTLNETRAIKSNFDAWIKKGRADSIELRKLLRDYVYVLLDTGARPGKELLELKWTQVELKMYPTIKKTGVIEKSNEYDDRGSEIETINSNRTVIINIQDSKTDSRLAIGRADTAKALEAIAQRNYGKTTAKLLKGACADYIFTYIEYIDEKKTKTKRKPKLLRPTSFSKLFDNYLESHNLQTDLITGKKRVLYSLRHTYATLALTHDKVAIHTLAKQMGTSTTMIEKHYSHLDAVKAVNQLRGDESRQLIDMELDDDDKKRYSYKEVEPKPDKRKR